MALLDDNPVLAKLNDIAACVCAQIVADGLPEPCFCGVVPGAIVAPEYSNCSTKCGMVWVRMVSAYPSTILGAADVSDRNCSKTPGLDVEIGAVRCIPVHSDGTPPTAAEMADVTALQIADMLSIRRALECCVGTRDLILGPYTPYGPEGVLVGGTWLISTQVFG